MQRTKIDWADYRKGTSRIRSGSYYLIYAPQHPCAKSKGHIYEHRYIMEKILGRFLETGEHIHHIDGNGLNNDSKNLRLTDPSCHSIKHYRDNPEKSINGTRALNTYADLRRKPRSAIACACGCGTTLIGIDHKGRDRKFIRGHNQRGRHWGVGYAEN